jgi:hypothetical protein
MRYVTYYGEGSAGTPPGKIRRVGYDLFVSQGIATSHEVDQWRRDDRASLDATPACLVDGGYKKKRKQKRRTAVEKKLELEKDLAAVQATAAEHKVAKKMKT